MKLFRSLLAVRMAVVFLGAFALTACIDIEMRFIMDRDGAGRLEISYLISHEATTLLDSVGGASVIPLPVSRDDFESALAGAEGVRLQRFRQSKDETGVRVKARIYFESIEALRSTVSFTDFPVFFMADGDGGGEFSQTIVSARFVESAPDPAMVELVQELAGDSRVTFVVVAPAKITAADGATIEADGRTAHFSWSLAKYLISSDPVDLVVRW